MEQKSHGSPSFINIAVLLLFAVIIAVASTATTYYFLNSKTNEETPVIQPSIVPPVQTNVISTTPPTSQTMTGTDETANWKVYKNTKYGYSIKYPNNWFVETTYSEADFTPRGGVEEGGIDYIGGDTIWSNYSKIDFTPEDDIPNDLQTISLLIYKTNQSILNFFNSKYNGIGLKILNEDKFTIHGKEVLSISFDDYRDTAKTDNPTGDKGNISFVKLNNAIMVWSGSTDEYQDKVLQLMLASLQFAK